MDKVFSKYKRGDVWYIKFAHENGDGVKGSSVQKKSRPHLIVSCEENNNHAPVFQVIPIATMDYDHLPPHVYFRNGDRNQIIMCEQITTISALDFMREGSHFMYSFNIDFMNKVDEALSGQLGLKMRVVDMKVLENLIDKIADKKEKELKKKYEDSLKIRVEEIAASISKRFGINLTSQDMLNGKIYTEEDLKYTSKETANELKETVKERTNIPTDQIYKSEDTVNAIPLPWNPSKTVSSSNSKPLIEVKSVEIPKSEKVKNKSSRNNWTREAMIQFMKDKREMSLQDLADKYNVKKKSIYQLTWLFEKRLNKDNDKDKSDVI